MAAAGLAAPSPPRFQKRGAQRLQSHPRVWGRQGHCPLTWSQKQASALDGHRTGTVPRGSQVQAGERAGLAGMEGRTRPPPGAVLAPHHTLTPAAPPGAGHCPGSRAGSGHSQGHGCGADIADSAYCAGHRRQGRGDRCCCCTGRAGTGPSRGPPGATGAQSSQRRSGHSGALESGFAWVA